jgi:hypothetical protein
LAGVVRAQHDDLRHGGGGAELGERVGLPRLAAETDGLVDLADAPDCKHADRGDQGGYHHDDHYGRSALGLTGQAAFS